MVLDNGTITIGQQLDIIGLTIRAAFIAEKITFHLEKMLDEEAIKDILDKCEGNTDYLPARIIILAYCQCMGTLSNDKLNLFALKRLLAQCGYKPSIPQEELASLVAKTFDQIGQIASVKNIKNELSEFEKIKRREDAIDLLSQNVIPLCQEALGYRLIEPALINRAKEIITKHSFTLKRMFPHKGIDYLNITH